MDHSHEFVDPFAILGSIFTQCLDSSFYVFWFFPYHLLLGCQPLADFWTGSKTRYTDKTLDEFIVLGKKIG